MMVVVVMMMTMMMMVMMVMMMLMRMRMLMLIRNLTSKERLAQGGVVVVGPHLHGAQAARADASTRSGTVFHVTRLLTESECLGSTELCPLLELAQPLFTFLLVVLVLHLDIVLRETLGPVVGKELAVATIQDVHFGIGQLGILEVVDCPVTVTDKLCHAWGTEFRVFAVEH